MRTIITETVAYKFEELSEEAQETALNHCRDWNVDHNWWEFTYDDAENIGCKISSFELDRSWKIDFECSVQAIYVAKKILKEHGETCDTYKLATEFLADYKKAEIEFLADPENDFEFEDSDVYDDLAVEFERALGEEYLSMLDKEYDYLTSDEAIQETILANEYEFDENGNLI